MQKQHPLESHSALARQPMHSLPAQSQPLGYTQQPVQHPQPVTCKQLQQLLDYKQSAQRHRPAQSKQSARVQPLMQMQQPVCHLQPLANIKALPHGPRWHCQQLSPLRCLIVQGQQPNDIQQSVQQQQSIPLKQSMQHTLFIQGQQQANQPMHTQPHIQITQPGDHQEQEQHQEHIIKEMHSRSVQLQHLIQHQFLNQEQPHQLMEKQQIVQQQPHGLIQETLQETLYMQGQRQIQKQHPLTYTNLNLQNQPCALLDMPSKHVIGSHQPEANIPEMDITALNSNNTFGLTNPVPSYEDEFSTSNLETSMHVTEHGSTISNQIRNAIIQSLFSKDEERSALFATQADQGSQAPGSSAVHGNMPDPDPSTLPTYRKYSLGYYLNTIQFSAVTGNSEVMQQELRELYKSVFEAKENFLTLKRFYRETLKLFRTLHRSGAGSLSNAEGPKSLPNSFLNIYGEGSTQIMPPITTNIPYASAEPLDSGINQKNMPVKNKPKHGVYPVDQTSLGNIQGQYTSKIIQQDGKAFLKLDNASSFKAGYGDELKNSNNGINHSGKASLYSKMANSSAVSCTQTTGEHNKNVSEFKDDKIVDFTRETILNYIQKGNNIAHIQERNQCRILRKLLTLLDLKNCHFPLNPNIIPQPNDKITDAVSSLLDLLTPDTCTATDTPVISFPELHITEPALQKAGSCQDKMQRQKSLTVSTETSFPVIDFSRKQVSDLYMEPEPKMPSHNTCNPNCSDLPKTPKHTVPTSTLNEVTSSVCEAHHSITPSSINTGSRHKDLGSELRKESEPHVRAAHSLAFPNNSQAYVPLKKETYHGTQSSLSSSYTQGTENSTKDILKLANAHSPPAIEQSKKTVKQKKPSIYREISKPTKDQYTASHQQTRAPARQELTLGSNPLSLVDHSHGQQLQIPNICTFLERHAPELRGETIIADRKLELESRRHGSEKEKSQTLVGIQCLDYETKTKSCLEEEPTSTNDHCIINTLENINAILIELQNKAPVTSSETGTEAIQSDPLDEGIKTVQSGNKILDHNILIKEVTCGRQYDTPDRTVNSQEDLAPFTLDKYIEEEKSFQMVSSEREDGDSIHIASDPKPHKSKACERDNGYLFSEANAPEEHALFASHNSVEERHTIGVLSDKREDDGAFGNEKDYDQQRPFLAGSMCEVSECDDGMLHEHYLYNQLSDLLREFPDGLGTRYKNPAKINNNKQKVITVRDLAKHHSPHPVKECPISSETSGSGKEHEIHQDFEKSVSVDDKVKFQLVEEFSRSSPTVCDLQRVDLLHQASAEYHSEEQGKLQSESNFDVSLPDCYNTENEDSVTHIKITMLNSDEISKLFPQFLVQPAFDTSIQCSQNMEQAATESQSKGNPITTNLDENSLVEQEGKGLDQQSSKEKQCLNSCLPSSYLIDSKCSCMCFSENEIVKSNIYLEDQNCSEEQSATMESTTLAIDTLIKTGSEPKDTTKQNCFPLRNYVKCKKDHIDTCRLTVEPTSSVKRKCHLPCDQDNFQIVMKKTKYEIEKKVFEPSLVKNSKISVSENSTEKMRVLELKMQPEALLIDCPTQQWSIEEMSESTVEDTTLYKESNIQLESTP
ncbi:uncharacterized protein [Ambystoma mexicanum]|uniref:uncharacterized protein n=1 Tax=Ambystoma mexicanum TaxID=8296 RepID=UPI0037E735E4